MGTCGLLPGSGHAVDMPHAFLILSVRCAGRHFEVRMYVDDMVLASLTSVNLRVNALKTVVVKHKFWNVWRAGKLPP
eukprot:5983845-Amphidinium_carterae.1